MNPFIVSDESVNRHGFRVLTSGIRTESFLKNPVMLWMHNRSDESLPIGRWENLVVENGVMKATPVFDDDDEFARKIKKKVENGFIRMASIGINPLKFSEDSIDIAPGQRYATVTECELIEISLADIGSNRNAVTLFDEMGKPVSLENITLSIPEINEKSMKNILLKLGIAENSNEDAAVQAIASLKTEIETLKTAKAGLEQQLQTLKDKAAADMKLKVKALVDAAVNDKRIAESLRDTYTALAEANYDATEKALAQLKPYKPLHMSVNTGNGGTEDDERQKWSFSDWQKKDHKGLELMKTSDPDRFKLLFKKEYGTEPKF